MSNARNIARLALSNTGTIGTTTVADGAITFAKMAASGWTSTQADIGYTRLPNGLLLQWGRQGANSTVQFPIAFTQAPFVVTASHSSSHFEGAGTYSFTSTSFYLYQRYGVTCWWFAIGK